MNAKQQQGILQGLVAASESMATAARALSGGNGGTPTVPALYLDFLPPRLRQSPRDFFAYGLDFASIPAGGGVGTESFTVQSDSDFLIVALAATVVQPAAQETAVPFQALTLTVRDSGSGRNFFNRAQGFGAVVGTGALPNYFPYPKFVDRSSEITASVTNNDSAQAALVRLSFLGFKIFDMMK